MEDEEDYNAFDALCDGCGKGIYYYEVEVKHMGKWFCSWKCYSAYYDLYDEED